MLKKIEDIERSLENKTYLSALALALTLPDICGGIEYPELRNKNGRLGKQQYIKWFDNFVEHYYADQTGWTEDFARAKNPFFTGEMCYQLRNSFLHAGNSQIGKWGPEEREEDKGVKLTYSYLFELSIGGVNSFGSSWPHYSDKESVVPKTLKLSIDIEVLCNFLCRAVKAFYNERDSKLFTEHNIEIIDFNNLPIRSRSK